MTLLSMMTLPGDHTCVTYREACEVSGLMDIDASLDKCFEEAAKW
jgi:hypothetical protein